MNLQEIRQNIAEISLPVLDQRNAFLVDLQVKVDRKAVLIQLFTDTDSGITIQECAEISRDLSNAIDRRRVFTEMSYRLEVSSPGIDKPLKFLRQYQKNVGRRFRVRFSRGTEQSLTGTLVSIEGDQLTFRPEQGEPISLSFDEIVESKEELPW